MKKLILLLLLCVSTQMHGMEYAKECKNNLQQVFTRARINLLYTWYNGDQLWKEGEHHAQAIDYYVKNRGIYTNCLYEDKNLQFARRDLVYHDQQFNEIYNKIKAIYKKEFTSMPCFQHDYDYQNTSCSDDFKKFREEVEKMRQE